MSYYEYFGPFRKELDHDYRVHAQDLNNLGSHPSSVIFCNLQQVSSSLKIIESSSKAKIMLIIPVDTL